MSEYIKKEEVLQALHDFWDECINFDGSGTELMLDNERVINSLPTYSFPDLAENKEEWIPVSERLPEKEKERYLIDYEHEGEEYITVSYYDKYGFWSSSNVRAWQPLPEPYKGESEDKE